MSAVAQTQSTEMLPMDVARLALEANENSVAGATDWFLNWMRENPQWSALHTDAILRRWAMDTVTHAIKGERVAAERQHRRNDVPSGVVPFQSALTEAVNANYCRMMDAPIWGGKKIGDATPQEIRESAHLFAENGKTMVRKAVWQNAIADAAEKNGAGINEPVRKVLSPKTFEQLWEESDAA